MKLRNIILTLCALALLASCSKEEEVYEKRDVKVESVFDNIEGKEEEKPAEEVKEEKKKEEPKKEEAEKPAEKPEQNQAQTNNNQPNQQTRTTNVLANLREGPTSFEENFILSVPAESKVDFIEEIYQDGVAWSKVRFNGREGYIRSDLLR